MLLQSQHKVMISLPSFHLQRYKKNLKYASKIMFIFLIFNSFYERQMRSDNWTLSCYRFVIIWVRQTYLSSYYDNYTSNYYTSYIYNIPYPKSIIFTYGQRDRYISSLFHVDVFVSTTYANWLQGDCNCLPLESVDVLTPPQSSHSPYQSSQRQ